ncbi:MAG: hypothetical protein LBR72_07670, partial [Oscillospiraceae bacterium]|nr:hypothetical protein [Oscillospiraceae bacterium]
MYRNLFRFAALLCCLLLLGSCAANSPSPSPTPEPPPPSEPNDSDKPASVIEEPSPTPEPSPIPEPSPPVDEPYTIAEGPTEAMIAKSR